MRKILASVSLLGVLAGAQGAQGAAPDGLRGDPVADGPGPGGIHVVDGSFVMSVNELHVNITNHGLIGSQYTQTYSYSHAPSGQWPAGSGHEYLWAGGLWVGGRLQDRISVSTGQYEREFRPSRDLWSTIYESRGQAIVRPGGNPGTGGRRVPDPLADDDRDGRIDEEIANGRDDDGDGRIDEDYAQIGDQMMTCTMTDASPLAVELYPDHEPLNVEVVQTAAAFTANDFDDFIALRYRVRNIGTAPIEDLYVGFMADCDIGLRGESDTGQNDRTGYFEGLVRASTNSWSYVRVGYMHDGGENPLPGYFGVTTVGTSTLRTFRYFGGNRSYEAGGHPIVDAERYEVMSSRTIDPYWDRAEPGDYAFYVGAGRREVLAPRQTVTFDIALVVGDGLEDLLENCANADRAYRGAYFDLDGDPESGSGGRETKLCFPVIPPSFHQIYKQTASLMDESCTGDVGHWPRIRSEDFFQAPDGSWCVWVNADNCEECRNRTGRDCTGDPYLFWENWNCHITWLSAPERLGCTGIAGRETRVPWFDTRTPPPSPGMRVWPRDGAVHVFWSDESEHAVDFETELVDFEAYRLWRADNWDRPSGSSLETGPGSAAWKLIAEYDVIDQMVVPGGSGVEDTLALGRNTGLEVVTYRPACLDDPRFAGLAEAMQAVVAADTEGLFIRRPLLRDGNGVPRAGLEALLAWESTPAVLDTFFMAAARPGGDGVVAKRPVRFYEHVDRGLHNGFLYFYSVTATDRNIEFTEDGPVNRGYGLTGSPNSFFAYTAPATVAQAAADRAAVGENIYVFPNPATRQALAEFQQYDAGLDDPTGVRIAFANLPASRNRIRVYTAAGDLVKELHHDGRNGYGQKTWNLVSENGQEIVSGVYLYSVESEHEGFDDFVGRFVVIR